MSLDFIFQKASGIATVYGKPLYQLVEVFGEVNPRDYVLDPIDGVISLTLNDKTMYVQVRKETMSLGIAEDQILTIGKFRATREENGTFNGESFVIPQGKMKLFAY